MPKKLKLKTRENNKSVSVFLDSIKDDKKRKDAKTVAKIMKDVTKKKPKMWGDSIVGFGSFEYKRSNGDEGEYLATGFSPRKNAITVYIMPGYKDYGPILKKLGPHKKSVSCLYLKSLDEIDLKILEKLIKAGLKDLSKNHTVK